MNDGLTEQQKFLIGQLERMMVSELPKGSFRFGDHNSQLYVNDVSYFDNIAFAFGVKHMYHEMGDLNFSLNLNDYESKCDGEEKIVPVWINLESEVSTFYERHSHKYHIPGHNEGI